MREETREAFWFGKIFTLWYVWVLLLSLGGTAVYLTVKPYFVAKETQIFRASNAYVTAKQSALRTMKADYDALAVKCAGLDTNGPETANLADALSAQQAGIVRQMKQEADTIPGQVPPDIAQFLAMNGR